MVVFTDNLFIDLLAIIMTIFVVVSTYFKWKLTFWERIGLQTLNPMMIFGDCKQLFLGKATFGEQFQEFYRKFKAQGLKHGGVYFGLTPFYVPVDPDIIKHIMVVDFQHFVNHGAFIDEEIDPLSGHLFNLEDSKWKNMRVKLTPTFTSGKMKMMFQTLVDCAGGLKSVLDDYAENKAPVDVKDTLGRFGTDVIGSVAFGLDCNSLKDPDCLFRKYGKKAFNDNPWDRVKALLQFIAPRSILRIVKFKITKNDVEEFFMKTVHETVAYREKNNINRKDFMHLLLQLKNRGSIVDDGKITNEEGDIGEKALTMNELIAQAYVFFIAGFETSSTTMSFALYEIATNPQVQDKLRKEINSVLAKHDNQLTYDAVMEMTYMEKVINETLRKYPPVSILFRQCNKDYTVPKTDIRLKKGTRVGIPVLGLQMDPQYYPDPEVFDPERFCDENKQKKPQCVWLPFGEGPRICIGMRFGILQTKVGLTTLLKNYKITLSSKTKSPLVIDKYCLITTALGGVWIDVEKLG